MDSLLEKTLGGLRRGRRKKRLWRRKERDCFWELAIGL